LLGFAKLYQKTKGFLKNKSKNQRFFDPEKSVSGLCPDTQVPPGKIPGGGMCDGMFDTACYQKSYLFFSHDNVMLLLLLLFLMQKSCAH